MHMVYKTVVDVWKLFGLPQWLNDKESIWDSGDPGSIPGLGIPLEEGMATHSSTLA